MSALQVRVLRQRLSLAWLAVGTGVMLWPAADADATWSGWSAAFWLLGAPLLMLAVTHGLHVARAAGLRKPIPLPRSSSLHRRWPQATRRAVRWREDGCRRDGTHGKSLSHRRKA